jgi:glycosyltransferase involved in cell wall biosynthesis
LLQPNCTGTANRVAIRAEHFGHMSTTRTAEGMKGPAFAAADPGTATTDTPRPAPGAGIKADSNQQGPRVSVVIPTLNEARNLPNVFGRLPSDVHEVIVVDGHSVDDTVLVARQLRPDVRIVVQTRKGKGNALACGFAAATGDVIAMIDADGSADPGEIPRFVKALVDGADFAKGTRFAEGAGSSDITRLRRLGNRVLSATVNMIYGTHYSDLCYGFNVFWRRHVSLLELDPAPPATSAADTRLWGDGFEIETLINIRIALAGLIVTEVASFEHPRIHGSSNLSTFGDGSRVLRTILAERLRARRRVAAPVVAAPARTRLPTASVIIAAYTMERWDELREAVASVRAQTTPVLETIVVIDHNPRLLARARRGLSGATVIANTGARGASGARNAGVAASHGNVVAFIDDDAVASPTWLRPLLRHFANPDVVGVGGHLNALWDCPRPRWLPPEFDWTVGASYRGMPENATPVRNVWSGNMAVRRQVFDSIGGFRDGFGKVGRHSAPEDTDLCLRAAAAHGGSWIYEPAGVAAHRVPPERATFGYFLARCFSEGRGKAVLASLNGAGQSVRAERRYVRRVLPGGVARGLRDALRGDPSGGSRSFAIVAGLSLAAAGFLAGRSAGLVRAARRRRRPAVPTPPPRAAALPVEAADAEMEIPA